MRSEITLEEGLLFVGDRVIVPKALRPQILIILHEGHLGRNRTLKKASEDSIGKD